jgi:hypothetical protein
VAVCLAVRDAKEDFEPICFKVGAVSGSEGNSARSSAWTLLKCSHAYLPDSPSLELALRNLEFEVPGRLERCDAERAVEGLDSSACASYRSLSVLTDLFSFTGGLLPVRGWSESSFGDKGALAAAKMSATRF